MGKKEQLQKLLATINATQAEYHGKEMPTDVGTALDAKCAEALALQGEIDAASDREKKIADLNAKSGRVADPSMPPEGKGRTDRAEEVVGYLSPGHLVAASPALADFLLKGKPQTSMHLAGIPSPFRRKFAGLVPLTAAMLAEVKAVPTIGANVIEPMRLPEIARTVEQDRLQLRDVIDVGTTTAAAVRYLRSTYTRAAATVAQGATKPEATIALESLLAAVRKIAVWLPVDDEQLADLPELSRLIDVELLYDLGKLLEELIMYGSGTGEEFLGICNDPDVPLAREEGGDTLIDVARRMITDVRVNRYDPNAIVVHPLDWEAIVLEKGSDNRYLFLIVQDGVSQRLHGLPVIETVATEDFAGVTTEERNMVVGDFRRGATLWDREQANVQVGWINDQFTKNQRTILAEARAAFAVRRPLAFVRHVTQTAAS